MNERKQTKIPSFQNYDEEAAFWDSHSLGDFEDELKVVKNVKVAHPLEHHLSVRLDADVIGELTDIAREKGVGPSTLARIWLMERLQEERSRHAGKSRSRQSLPHAPASP